MGASPPAPRRTRFALRLVWHHVPFPVLGAAAALALAWTLRSPDPLFRASLTTGYVSLALLAGTLLTGPVNVLRGRPNPVSTDLRRDLGIWTAIVGLVHVVLGLQVHMRGRWWLYFVYAPGQRRPLGVPVRVDLFGFANHTGLVATLLLALLLAISNDYSLRQLGSGRWKSLQRWNYGLAAFVVLHSVAYQLIERRDRPYVIALAVLTVGVTVVQLIGYRRRARRRAARSA